MPFQNTGLPGLLIFEPLLFQDERGYFFESYNEQTCHAAGVHIKFIQDNQAKSTYGVVRGLHYQQNPFAQTKFIRVLEGVILDVVVDLRKGSPSFGNSFSLELSSENKKQLLVPKGFAHGYAVLSTSAEVFYKCDTYYNKEAEGGIALDDDVLNIDWGIPPDKRIISDKDTSQPKLKNCNSNFLFSL